MRSVTNTRVLGVAAAAVVAIAGLAGCTSPSAGPVEQTNTGQPSASSSAPPAAPELQPAGTAEDNLAYFTAVVSSLLSAEPEASGRDIIDHLVASGFDKSAMELTADTTAVGLEADNLQFSVAMNGSCLIGQEGNVGLHTITAPLLATGTCLVGNTRAIDW